MTTPIPPTTLPRDPWLDLDAWVGQRQATFKFEAIHGGTGAHLSDLHPLYEGTLSHDSSATIPRQLDVQFDRADTAALNTITDRIRLSMVLRGKQWPLGVYMFADQTRTRLTPAVDGLSSDGSLFDEMFLVDQPIDQSFTGATPAGVPRLVDDVLAELLAPLPITAIIEPTPYRSIGAWPIGTRRGKIIADLALDGDYLNPWFDNNGNLRFVRVFDPALALPTFDFDNGRKVNIDSITESDNLITAPNRFVVIGNGPASAAGPIVGTYDIPASAPHSIANRGFVIPDTEERQLTSVAQAQAVATSKGLQQMIYQTTDLSTSPDPRHDGYAVVRWLGVNWLEVGWQMTLSEGAPMRHTLKRAYQP